MKTRVIFILNLVLILSLTSCGGSRQNTVVCSQENTEIQHFPTDTTVIVSETDSLILYKPIFFGGIGMDCEYNCEPAVTNNRIFVAAGAYTKTYKWTEFADTLVAGPYVDGKFYEGYTAPANSGAFYYVHSARRWGFAHHGYEQVLRDIAKNEENGTAFSQVMLVYNGALCSIDENARPYKSTLRRAICDIDNELYIVDSKYDMNMYEFAKCLKAARVFHGLYMDMGYMRYSAYKTSYEGEWIEIHPRNPLTKYCSNYIVFYYVD
jgi:hypothetical protein